MPAKRTFGSARFRGPVSFDAQPNHKNMPLLTYDALSKLPKLHRDASGNDNVLFFSNINFGDIEVALNAEARDAIVMIDMVEAGGPAVAGDTLSFGGVTFTFVNAGGGAFDVPVGANAIEQRNNLINKINAWRAGMAEPAGNDGNLLLHAVWKPGTDGNKERITQTGSHNLVLTNVLAEGTADGCNFAGGWDAGLITVKLAFFKFILNNWT